MAVTESDSFIRVKRIVKPISDFRNGDYRKLVIEMKDLEKPLIKTAFYKTIESHAVAE